MSYPAVDKGGNNAPPPGYTNQTTGEGMQYQQQHQQPMYAPQPVMYSSGQPVQYQQQQVYAQPQYVQQGQPMYTAQPVVMAQPVMYQAQPQYAQQPQMVMTAGPQTHTVVIQNAQPMYQAPTPWQTDLCGWSEDCGTCLLSMVCPCYVIAKNEELKNPQGDGCCCTFFLAWAMAGLSYFCFCIWPFWTGSLRTNTRLRYNISGDSCEDMMCHCFCQPCALTQENIEIRKRNAQKAGGQPPNAQMR